MKNYYIETKITQKDESNLLKDCKTIEDYYVNKGLSATLNKFRLNVLKQKYPLFYESLKRVYKNVGFTGKVEDDDEEGTYNKDDVSFKEFWEDLDSDGDDTYFKWIISVIKDFAFNLKNNKPMDKIINKEIHNDELGISDYLNQGEQDK